jgi:hypothetical protein
MCFSFRFLSRQINPERPFYSWLIFPFVYTGIYYSGFYNFELGIVLFLLTSATWMWVEKKPRNVWSILLLTVLSTLLLLSHLIPFLLFVFVIGSKMLVRLFKKEYRSFLIDSGFLFLVILPAFILILIYHNGRTEATGDYRWADPQLTFFRLIELRHLTIHDMRQKIYAVVLSASLLSAAIISFILFLRKKKQNENDNPDFIFWGFCLIFIIVLVFAVPDDFGGSGAMTSRLIEISWIFLLLFLSAGKFPKIIVGVLAVISFSVAMIMTQVREGNLSLLNSYPKKVMRLSKYIMPNITGVYIPLTSNWLCVHVGELAFAEKKSTMLSDYETTHDFFLLKWGKNFSFNYTVGGLNAENLPNSFWPAQKNKPKKNIDYVLLCSFSPNDTVQYSKLYDSLRKYYTMKKSEFPFYLYQSQKSISDQKKITQFSACSNRIPTLSISTGVLSRFQR